MKFILFRVLRMLIAVLLAVVIFSFVSDFIGIEPIRNIWEDSGRNMLIGFAQLVLAAAFYYLLEIYFARKK